MSRRSGCGRAPLTMRLRDWWDLRRHRHDSLLAYLDALGGDEPPAGAGMREPRRPLLPFLSAGATLDLLRG
jgi:hypothetical protein